jgi:hypothetical protein
LHYLHNFTLVLVLYVLARGAQIYQYTGIRLKIVGAKTVARDELHTKDTQILGITLQDLAAQNLRASGYGPEISSYK